MRQILAIVALLFFTAPALAGGKSVPRSAKGVIASVHAAAAAKDAKALRRLMGDDFVSSFGGDGGRAEALALWASYPTYFQHLAKATSGSCELEYPGYVQCPRNAGIGLRAGFKLVGTTWVFSSFVGGD